MCSAHTPAPITTNGNHCPEGPGGGTGGWLAFSLLPLFSRGLGEDEGKGRSSRPKVQWRQGPSCWLSSGQGSPLPLAFLPSGGFGAAYNWSILVVQTAPLVGHQPSNPSLPPFYSVYLTLGPHSFMPHGIMGMRAVHSLLLHCPLAHSLLPWSHKAELTCSQVTEGRPERCIQASP